MIDSLNVSFTIGWSEDPTKKDLTIQGKQKQEKTERMKRSQK